MYCFVEPSRIFHPNVRQHDTAGSIQYIFQRAIDRTLQQQHSIKSPNFHHPFQFLNMSSVFRFIRSFFRFFLLSRARFIYMFKLGRYISFAYLHPKYTCIHMHKCFIRLSHIFIRFFSSTVSLHQSYFTRLFHYASLLFNMHTCVCVFVCVAAHTTLIRRDSYVPGSSMFFMCTKTALVFGR